jgi:type 1 fimbriae regulatory protein FimB
MREIKYLKEPELKDFFKQVEASGNTRDILLMKLVYHHAMRVQEVVNLRLEDFQDLGKDSELYIKGIKKGLIQSQPMVEGDIKLMRKWLKVREKYKDVAEWQQLFITARGALSKSQVQRVFRKHALGAGLEARLNKAKRPELGIHMLRHSAGCTFAREGASTDLIRKRMRHKNLESTQVYIDLEGKEEKERQKKANSFFKV